jgi:hypothetical protein
MYQPVQGAGRPSLQKYDSGRQACTDRGTGAERLVSYNQDNVSSATRRPAAKRTFTLSVGDPSGEGFEINNFFYIHNLPVSKFSSQNPVMDSTGQRGPSLGRRVGA